MVQRVEVRLHVGHVTPLVDRQVKAAAGPEELPGDGPEHQFVGLQVTVQFGGRADALPDSLARDRLPPLRRLPVGQFGVAVQEAGEKLPRHRPRVRLAGGGMGDADRPGQLVGAGQDLPGLTDEGVARAALQMAVAVGVKVQRLEGPQDGGFRPVLLRGRGGHAHDAPFPDLGFQVRPPPAAHGGLGGGEGAVVEEGVDEVRPAVGAVVAQ